MSLSSKIIIITAPSGTGKTTINRRLVQEIDALEFSVSYTTRKKRKGEQDGVHYWFIDRSQFDSLVEQKGMIEWANVFGLFYGTGYSELERAKANNKSILLEIDVQGWNSVKEKLTELCSLFILPPSMKELWRRLNARGSETQEVIRRRFETAKQEIKIGLAFEHFVINDDLERTYQLIKNFLLQNKTLPMTKEDGRKHCRSLLKELDSFKP